MGKRKSDIMKKQQKTVVLLTIITNRRKIK